MASSYDHNKPGDQTLDRKSVGELLSEALTQLSLLARTEAALLRAEVIDKGKRAVRGGAMLGAAALVAIPSLAILMLALTAFLVERGIAASLSCLITAVVGFVVSGVLAKIGLDRLRSDVLLPRRTMNQIQRDAVTLKEHL